MVAELVEDLSFSEKEGERFDALTANGVLQLARRRAGEQAVPCVTP
jgi:hypothetical protein